MSSLVPSLVAHLKKTKIFHRYYKFYKYRKYYIRPFEPILKTRSFRCDPQAKTEVHSLVSHSHLFLYLTAIKSLLRFYNELAVVVHDDGTLTAQDKGLLMKHVHGMRIIDRKRADQQMMEILKPFAHCRQFRQEHFIAIQLFDFAWLSKSGKIVALDSDTLFLKKPERLIQFAQSDKKELIHLYEKSSEAQKEFLIKFRCQYPPNFNFGFVCSYKEIVDLKVIEAILGKLEAIDWWSGQSLFPILIEDKLKEYPASFFDRHAYQNINGIEPDPTFRHYWSNVLVNSVKNPTYKKLMDIYLKDSQTILNELKSG